MKVSLFVTCLGDQFFSRAAADAVRLLRHLGCEVDFPTAQSCCGQPAFTMGERDAARSMAAHTCGVFSEADYVVLPSGSCAAMVRHHYPALLEGHEQSGENPIPNTFELSQFIVDVLGISDVGQGLAETTVALHQGCHALRNLHARDTRAEGQSPRILLEGSGAELVPWEAQEECCGFGGVFSTKLPEVSTAMADRKLDTVPRRHTGPRTERAGEDAGPVLVTSADPGCLLHLEGRARLRGTGHRFVHLASLLWKAVGETP